MRWQHPLYWQFPVRGLVVQFHQQRKKHVTCAFNFTIRRKLVGLRTKFRAQTYSKRSTLNTQCQPTSTLVLSQTSCTTSVLVGQRWSLATDNQKYATGIIQIPQSKFKIKKINNLLDFPILMKGWSFGKGSKCSCQNHFMIQKSSKIPNWRSTCII